MRKQIAYVWVVLFSVILSVVLLYAPQPATTQDQDNTWKRFESDRADLLTNSGLIALRILNGAVHVDPGSLGKGLDLDRPRFDRLSNEVMVNNPDEDVNTFYGDLSLQSETATAGFGNTVLVAFNDDGEIFSNLTPSIMGYGRSTDGGATFKDMGLIPTSGTSQNLGDPSLIADRSGKFYASYIGYDSARPVGFQSVLGIQKSTDGGLTWGLPVHPAIGGVSYGSFQDKPFMTVDTTGGTKNGNLYLSWTSFDDTSSTACSHGCIFFSRSTDGGSSFSTPFLISTPTGTFNQGSEPAVGPGGEVYVAWYQGIVNGNILVAKSTNGGASFTAPVVAASLTRIGFAARTLTGNFRVNSFPRIDVNPLSGDVYIIYAANPPGPDGADVFFIRSTDGGASWSMPIRVNDDDGMNDQWFPDLAVNGRGVIEAFWYDRRDDPKNYRISVYAARSTDGGRSFARNLKLTPGTQLPTVGFDPISVPTYMGDYIDIKSKTTSVGNGRATEFLLAWGDFRRMITTLGGRRSDQDVFFTTH